MNIEEWVAYFEVEEDEEISFYKELPCIEKGKEHSLHDKIIYPLPFLEKVAGFLPPCTITFLSYKIQNESDQHLDCIEFVSLDVDFGHFQCFFSLNVTHSEQLRTIRFDESLVSSLGMIKSPTYIEMVQNVYNSMKNFIGEYSPYRLEMVTNEYSIQLPGGVKDVC